jgi:beta-mannosidase
MRAIEMSLCGDGWTLHHPDGRSWPSRVPGCAHTDLMRAGEIPSPDAPGGEDAQTFVGLTGWTWTRSIGIPEEMRAHSHVEIVFECIDTVAQVSVDGRTALEADNAFHPWRVALAQAGPAAGAVAAGAEAVGGAMQVELRVCCAAPVAEVKRLEAMLGPRPVNGDWTPYPFMRKAACNFGWDWGPRVPTSGLPAPVTLHAWTRARIDTVRPLVVSCDAREAHVDVRVSCVCDGDPHGLSVRVSLESPDGRRWEEEAALGRDGTVSVRITVPSPLRWWPRGHGAPHLHALSVELESNSATLERRSMRIGLRSVSLDQSPDAEGMAFAVRVNGTPVWCAGANWIPEGLFRPAAAPAEVRERIMQACDAHMNMLRVWGGGGYESESFYEACDELGVMVWQDFAFACATYPEDAPFPERVEREARWQVSRLSRHPSVVLWCGGNEDILAWWSWGFRERLAHGQSWGRMYWLELLPRICAELDPTRPYWPESPWSGSLELNPNDRGRGDCHIWDADAKVEAIRGTPPRFASEFGHQSPPALRTVAEAFALAHGDSPPADAGSVERELSRAPAARACGMLAARQRAWGGDDAQYAPFLRERFAPPSDFMEWLVQAQVVQARAMRAAYTWFRAHAPRCMGALCWQMNDAWTGHSWSLVDVAGRTKPAWHAVRDACAPRIIVLHERTLPGGRRALVLDAVNATREPWRASAVMALHPLDGSRPVARERADFVVEPGSSVTVAEVPPGLVPDRHAILIADAATGLASHPETRSWHAAAHDVQLAQPCGEPWLPRAELAVERPGPHHAAVRICAATPLADAVVVPMGDWRSVDRMLLTMSAGESAAVRLEWRGRDRDADGACVELHCGGRRIAAG